MKPTPAVTLDVPPAGVDADRDQRLARVLAEVTEHCRQGACPNLESVVQQHRDLADDLRALWPALMVAEAVARPDSHAATLVSAIESAPPIAESSAALPRSLGDYELEKELGRGGMGVVFKAWQKSLQRPVAVKMMLRGPLASTADLVRFRTEAEAAARLDHPNIVPVYQIGESDGQPYFSMKYIEGKTLAELLAKGPVPARDAARYLLAVARAVHHAHQCGILHRDLKPSNVLIDAQGQPHVTDFGLAKRVEGGASVTHTGAILGTPSYMAPEQAAGNRGSLSAASDVYSLGAILYHLLTGRPPFQAASPVDTLMLVLEQEPVPPRLLNPQVPRELEMICLKCLQKPADLRYESAAQLADDLESYLQGEPVSAGTWSVIGFVDRMLRPTHHAIVLENWGLLWMWHSLVLFVLCAATNVMQWQQVRSPGPYLALWVIGLGAWASIFWALRRRGGPITFVERQVAHIWGASVVSSTSLFAVELVLGLEVLTLAPVLAVIGGACFLAKAGVLSGSFYLAAGASFVTAILMALFPQIGLLLFGLVSAAGFFFPGLKYYRQRVRKR